MADAVPAGRADVAAVAAGAVLRVPSAEEVRDANMTAFMRQLAADGVADASSYEELWRWSVDQPDEFWTAVWRFAGVRATGEPSAVRVGAMPGTRWFPGTKLNYAEHALARRDDHVAVVFRSETDGCEVTYAELAERVRRAAAGLRRLGVGPGDRVAAYLPSRVETVVAFLATASLGAVWTICSPDFGARSVLERFRQVEPKVLLASPGYRFGGTLFDRRDTLAELVDGLPSVAATVVLDHEGVGSTGLAGVLRWDALEAETGEQLGFEPVAFDHPLWVVYTSGTTGPPKSIVHGHGGIVLEHHKLLRLHLDLTPDDRLFWFTTTGWVMWNIVVGGLLTGMSVVLFDGSPAHPTTDRLWDLAADTGTTFFGTSAGFVHAAAREGRLPSAGRDLSAVRGVGVTGSPLSPAGHAWLYDAVGPDVFVASISGGTDVCTAFLGSSVLLPQRAGRIQARCLGVAAACYDEEGRPVVGRVGELVVTQPIPSMPVGFWGDADGARYRASYFEDYPGVWRHGDWVELDDDGSCLVFGRSDATLNRGGVRMGTSEFYNVLEGLPELADAVIVDTTAAGEESGRLLLLAVVGAPDVTADALAARARAALRAELSPRHVPDEVLVVPRLPHTLNGKRLEVPIRKLFLGRPVEEAVDPSAVDDRDALSHVEQLAREWRARHTSARPA